MKVMIDNSVVKNLFFDMLKFMISVIALCWSSSYFLAVAYSYAAEGVRRSAEYRQISSSYRDN